MKLRTTKQIFITFEHWECVDAYAKVKRLKLAGFIVTGKKTTKRDGDQGYYNLSKKMP